MEIASRIQPGSERESFYSVGEENTAIHVGSGTSKVLATPWMIAFMERTSHQLLVEILPPGYTSVGILVNVRHLAPTPVGSTVRVNTRVLEVEGFKITFEVKAWDTVEQIGKGTHQRYIVEEKRFLQRADAKRTQAGSSIPGS
jgi:fluoroacetyl-CoA thioesterase